MEQATVSASASGISYSLWSSSMTDGYPLPPLPSFLHVSHLHLLFSRYGGLPGGVTQDFTSEGLKLLVVYPGWILNPVVMLITGHRVTKKHF